MNYVSKFLLLIFVAAATGSTYCFELIFNTIKNDTGKHISIKKQSDQTILTDLPNGIENTINTKVDLELIERDLMPRKKGKIYAVCIPARVKQAEYDIYAASSTIPFIPQNKNMKLGTITIKYTYDFGFNPSGYCPPVDNKVSISINGTTIINDRSFGTDRTATGLINMTLKEPLSASTIELTEKPK